MAWNGYEDWLNKVKNSGYYFSDYDLERAQNDEAWANRAYDFKKGWYDARDAGDTDTQAYYHGLMENLRADRQYSGGAEGDEYHPWGGRDDSNVEPTRPSWDTNGATSAALATAQQAVENYAPYVSPYQPQIDAAVGKVVNNTPYVSPYAGRIESALSDVENWGPYNSPYQGQIDTSLRRILAYDPYRSQYGDQIDAALKAVNGRGPFEYDYRTDPAYQAYAKEYAREGRRASEDTLGQFAAMTGGVPSTAAMTAAQQAGNYYAAQTADKIPELYKLAYDMYLSEGDQLQQRLNNLRSVDNDAYNRYMDSYNRLLSGLNAVQGQDAVLYGRYGDAYNRRLNALDELQQADATAYGRYGDEFNRDLTALDVLTGQDATSYGRYGDTYDRLMDAYSLNRDADQTAYNRYRDTVGDWETDRSFNYGMSRDNWSDALTAAEYGDYSQLNALGVDTERYQRDAQYKQDLDRAMTALEMGDTAPMAALGFDMSNYGDKLFAYGDGQQPYEIGSRAGIDFVQNAMPGATMNGGDGSVWTKSADGTTVTITKDGKTWTVSTGLTLSGGRGYGGRGKGDDEDEDETGNEPTVDMASVEALGYGPISAERLSNLVDSGEVEKYLENGQWKFRKRGTVYTQPLFTDWFKQKFGN